MGQRNRRHRGAALVLALALAGVLGGSAPAQAGERCFWVGAQYVCVW